MVARVLFGKMDICSRPATHIDYVMRSLLLQFMDPHDLMSAGPPDEPHQCTVLHSVVATMQSAEYSRLDRAGLCPDRFPTLLAALSAHYLPDSNGLVLDAPCPGCNAPAPPLTPELKQLVETARTYQKSQRAHIDVLLNTLLVQPLRAIVCTYLYC
jgi:hypothetical protein